MFIPGQSTARWCQQTRFTYKRAVHGSWRLKMVGIQPMIVVFNINAVFYRSPKIKQEPVLSKSSPDYTSNQLYHVWSLKISRNIWFVLGWMFVFLYINIVCQKLKTVKSLCQSCSSASMVQWWGAVSKVSRGLFFLVFIWSWAVIRISYCPSIFFFTWEPLFDGSKPSTCEVMTITVTKPLF